LLAKGSLHKQNTQAKKQRTRRNKLHIRTFLFGLDFKVNTKMYTYMDCMGYLKL